MRDLSYQYKRFNLRRFNRRLVLYEAVIDTRGQKCPQPFVEMVKAFMKMGGRGRVRILTDDETCKTFIPDYGKDLDFNLVSIEDKGGYYEIVMSKEDGGS